MNGPAILIAALWLALAAVLIWLAVRFDGRHQDRLTGEHTRRGAEQSRLFPTHGEGRDQ